MSFAKRERFHQQMLDVFKKEVFLPLQKAFSRFDLKYFWNGECLSHHLGDKALGAYWSSDNTIVIRPPSPDLTKSSRCWIDVLMTTIHETAHGALLKGKWSGGGFKSLYAEAEARLAEVVAYEKMEIQLDPDYYKHDFQQWMKNYRETCTEEGRKIFMPRHKDVEVIVDVIIAALPERFQKPSCETFCPDWYSCKLPRRLYSPSSELKQMSLFSGAVLGELRDTLSASRKTIELLGETEGSKPKDISFPQSVELRQNLLWKHAELLAAFSVKKGGTSEHYGVLKKTIFLSRDYLKWLEVACIEGERVSIENRYEELVDVLNLSFDSLSIVLGKEGSKISQDIVPLGLLLEEEIPDLIENMSEVLLYFHHFAARYFSEGGLSREEMRRRLEGDIAMLPEHLYKASKAGVYWSEHPDIVRDIAIILAEAVERTIECIVQGVKMEASHQEAEQKKEDIKGTEALG